MKLNQNRHQSMSAWQRIFSQSKINGAPYTGETIPIYKWKWPTGTYLQQRLACHESLKKLAMSHSRDRENGQKLAA